ncbi:MAG: DUF2914 domain-containing protein, partial [Myxococcales bacterium]|nr:DUF2914 domain-containing protein [Myxococcales bacterium]
ARPAIPPVIEGDPQARQAKPGASAAVAAVRADVLPAPTTAKAAPAKATPSAPARPAAKSDGLVRVVEAALASDVVDREPVGAGTSFSLDEEKIWAWVKLENTGEPTSVTMVWRKGDEVAFRYELKVGQSKSWRTWSRKTVRKGDAGDWSVDVLDADGALLKTLDFTLGADGTTAG